MTRGTTNIPVAGVILKRDGKFAALRRSNTGYQDGKYGLPAGHVEHGENFRTAACRELFEETGIIIRPDQLIFKVLVHERHGSDDDIRVSVIFEAADWQGEPFNAEVEKHDQLAWLSPAALPANMMSILPTVFSVYNRGESYAEWGWER